MTSQFAAHSIPVGRLLAAPFLIETPAYQRSYVWTEEEAARLLEDLVTATETALNTSGNDTAEVADFLGTILLVDRDEAAPRLPGWPFAGPARAFEVVDGLQRLTTLCILMCVLRDIARANGEPDDQRIAAAVFSESAPWLRLRGNDESFFQAYVRTPKAGGQEPVECSSPAEERIASVRKMFANALSALDRQQRVRLAAFLIDSCYVVLIATTGIDRAHRMFMVLNERGKPLARNDILKADTLGRAGASASAVSAIWEAMEQRLGHDFETLFSHLRAMYGRPSGPIISSIRSIADGAGGAQTFVSQILKPAADAFEDIRSARADRWPQADEVAQLLRYLHWLPANDWVPPTMQYWLSAAARNGSMIAFLRALDRLAHAFKIMGMGAGKRTSRFAAITSTIRKGEDPLGPGGPLALTGAEERVVRYNLRDIHARAPIMAKIILMRVNDRLGGRPQGLGLEAFTVEHVLPRKHNASSQWRRWFEDPAIRTACTESLGNLLLLTKAQNDKAGNQDLSHKQSVYFQAGIPVPPLNAGLKGLTAWGPDEVTAREAMLHAHVDAIWGFGLTSTGAQQEFPAEGPLNVRGPRRMQA